jgi:trimethylamine--corrinoid protein Co-methyltransferase
MVNLLIKVKTPKLEILSAEQISEIHEATCRVLEKSGMVFKNRKALNLFKEVGAEVDMEKEKVYIPTHLVEEAVRKAPTRFTWYAPNHSRSIHFGEGRVHFGTVSTPSFVYDLDTGKKRNASFADCKNVSKILDYLQLADSGYCSLYPLDVPDQSAHVHMILAQVLNTDKCIRGRGRGTHIAQDCIKMMSILEGLDDDLIRKPMLVCNFNSVSPLQYDTKILDGAIEYSMNNQVVIPSPEILAGATGPITLAGTIVENNAETLALITLSQLVNPGCPVMYGTVSAAFDMRNSTFRLGGPELSIMHIAFAQLSRFYQIPMRGTAGTSDAKTLDIQAGYETAHQLMTSVMAGVDLVTYAFGSMEFTATLSYEKMVLDHEFLETIELLVNGINVDDETLAVDLIDKVGHGGHFLSQKHTRKYHRQENFIPELFDTRTYEVWEASNDTDIVAKAKRKIGKIINEHPSPSVEPEIEKRLRDYVEKVVKRKEV